MSWRERGESDCKNKGNIIRLVFLLPLLLILSGCASGYSKFYTQRIDEKNLGQLEILKDNQEPVIIKTNNLKNEIDRYFTKNYLIIGVSHFNGGMEPDENIISQAKDVKATLVLQTSSFVTTQGSSMPLITPNGFGGLNTTAMYNQQMRYDQEAVFMAKNSKKLKFGLFFDELTTELKKQYERNTGVVVRVTVEGSPTFNANIIPGDLIISIDGNSVHGVEQASKLLNDIPLSTDKVMIKVIRNNTEKDIAVHLAKP